MDSFHNANATIPQAMDFVLDYIDKNIPLCQCAYESLGEQQLKIIFEKDLRDFVSATIDYFSTPAILIKGHGAFAAGETLEQASMYLSVIESASKILYLSEKYK